MQEKDITTISTNNPLYPAIFKQLKRPPGVVYAKGDLSLLMHPHIAGIVGTRRTTKYGRDITYDISKTIATNGAVIISGLAYGIDSIAHKGALAGGGKTIAVLPSGINNVYPAAHTELASEIVRSGGLLISELKPHEAPFNYHFVERNRLIAALCKVLLVTEAAKNSGTCHTVEYAHTLNKIIAAVPGNINNPMSKGVNKLFFQGAQPVLEAADLLSLLGLHEKIIKPKYKAENNFERDILNLLEEYNLTGNELLKETNFEVSTLNVHLTMLEIKGVIQNSGSRWKLL